MTQSSIAQNDIRTGTMRAAVQHEFGRPDTIAIETVAIPVPAEGEVLVRTRAAGINPVDAFISGGGSIGLPVSVSTLREGVVMGWDIAGEVVGLGSGVTEFEPGDRVFGMIRFPEFGRAFAEYVTAPVNELRRIPDGVTFESAGAVPLVGLTALQALFDEAQLESGQRILVHGASGGVGHIVVQLAKHVGAYVIATASAANVDFVKELGADEVIAYDTARFEDEVADVDVVFNPFGDEIVARSWSVLKCGGFLVSLMATPVDAPNDIRTTRMFVETNGDKIGQLGELMASGSVRVHVGQQFPFDQIQGAFAASLAGHAVGKTIVTF